MGRLFFALIFLMAVPNNFTKQGIAYAASQGAPLASIGVPLMGVISALEVTKLKANVGVSEVEKRAALAGERA